jgi:flagellar biosynthetic protein FliP
MTTTSMTSTAIDGSVRRHYHAIGRFTWHFLEMVIAMAVGMALGPVGALLDYAFGVELSSHPASHAIVMATDMAIGMAVWMRIRGHNRRSIGEMSAAMYLPFVMLLVPYGLGYLSGGALIGVGHILMLPAMLVAMLARRDEYGAHHHSVRKP